MARRRHGASKGMNAYEHTSVVLILLITPSDTEDISKTDTRMKNKYETVRILRENRK